jgi:hypothetical protein
MFPFWIKRGGIVNDTMFSHFMFYERARQASPLQTADSSASLREASE